jgi:hypothetical protein
MSHFAKVENGIVTEVIVAEQDFINVLPNPELWIQTSYNTKNNVHYAPNTNTPDGGIALRGNYAGIGFIYDSINDVFYSPQPYPSWILNKSNWSWESPIPYPIDGNHYVWNETVKNWEIENV